MIWKIVPRFINLSFSITASAALRFAGSPVSNHWNYYLHIHIYIYLIHAHLFLSSSSRQMKEENYLKWLLLSTAYTHSKIILMCSAFCRCWDLEVKRSAKTLKKPALSRVLIKCYGRSYAVAGLFVFFLVGAGGERRRKSVACSPYLLCNAWAFLESAFAC